MIFRKLVLTIVFFACLAAGVSAQQIEYRPVLTGLVLEVTFIKDGPLAYQSVPWSDARNDGDWYARFGRIPGWQLPVGALPVAAVRLKPSLKGDIVTLNVSVLRGGRHDIEEMVSTHQLRENEKISLEALRNFGVAPFEIEVIRVVPTSANAPAIINKTRSLDVVAVESHLSNLPGFKLTIHNLSDKNVCALTLNGVSGRETSIAMPQGSEGRTKIEAGGYLELPFPLAQVARAAPGASDLVTPPNQHVVITSVVFEDGSYEGDSRRAAQYLAFAVGRRIELRRILPVLQGALNATNDTEAPNRLRSALQALSFETDDGDFTALFAAFPALSQKSLRSTAQSAIHGLRKRLLDELQTFQDGKRVTPPDFRFWLIDANQRYSAWLARANK